MATYIPNLTDRITPPYLFTPDLQFLIQSGQAAKQLYETYLQKAAEIYGTYANTDLYNEQISKVRDEYVKSIDNTIKQITKVDWLNAPSDYINAVSKAFQPLISTPQIAKAFKIVNDYNWFKLKEYENKDRVIAPPHVRETNKATDFTAYQIYDPELSKEADTLFKIYTKMDYNDPNLFSIDIPEFKLGIDIKAYLHDAFEQIKAKFGGVEGIYYVTPDGKYKELKEGDNEVLYRIITGPDGQQYSLGSILFAKTKEGGEEKYLPVSNYILDLLRNPNIQDYYRSKMEARYIGMLETYTPAEVYKRMLDDIDAYKAKFLGEYNLIHQLWNATKLEKDAQEKEIMEFVKNENLFDMGKASILENKIKSYQALMTIYKNQSAKLRDLEEQNRNADEIKNILGDKYQSQLIAKQNLETISKTLESGKIPIRLSDVLKDIKYVTPVLAEYQMRIDAIDWGIDFANALSDVKIQSLGSVGNASGGGGIKINLSESQKTEQFKYSFPINYSIIDTKVEYPETLKTKVTESVYVIQPGEEKTVSTIAELKDNEVREVLMNDKENIKPELIIRDGLVENNNPTQKLVNAIYNEIIKTFKDKAKAQGFDDTKINNNIKNNIEAHIISALKNNVVETLRKLRGTQSETTQKTSNETSRTQTLNTIKLSTSEKSINELNLIHAAVKIDNLYNLISGQVNLKDYLNNNTPLVNALRNLTLTYSVAGGGGTNEESIYNNSTAVISLYKTNYQVLD